MRVEDSIHNWTISAVIAIGFAAPLLVVSNPKLNNNFKWMATDYSYFSSTRFASARVGEKLAFQDGRLLPRVPNFPSAGESPRSNVLPIWPIEVEFGELVVMSPVEMGFDELPPIVDVDEPDESAKPRPPESLVVE